jgi:hypothetical protein
VELEVGGGKAGMRGGGLGRRVGFGQAALELGGEQEGR